MNHLETSPHGFVILSGLSFAVALFVSWAGLRRYVFLPSVCTLISQNYILLGILSNPESVTADSRGSAKLACLIRFRSLGYPSLFADEKRTAGRDIHSAFGNHPYFTPHTCTDTPLN